MSGTREYEETRFTAAQAAKAIRVSWRNAAIGAVALYLLWVFGLTGGGQMLLASVVSGPAVACLGVLMYRERRQWRAHHERWLVFLTGLLMPIWAPGVAYLLLSAGLRASGGEIAAISAAMGFVLALTIVERSVWVTLVVVIGGVIAAAPAALSVRLSSLESWLMVPTALATVLAAIAVGNHRYIRGRVAHPGRCRECGYEAGGLGTCPECAGSVEPLGA